MEIGTGRELHLFRDNFPWINAIPVSPSPSLIILGPIRPFFLGISWRKRNSKGFRLGGFVMRGVSLQRPNFPWILEKKGSSKEKTRLPSWIGQVFLGVGTAGEGESLIPQILREWKVSFSAPGLKKATKKTLELKSCSVERPRDWHPDIFPWWTIPSPWNLRPYNPSVSLLRDFLG